MDTLRAVPPDFFSHLEAEGRIETALLLRRNGRLLAAWSRTPVAWEVLSIMAATALGSLDTMLETLHAPSPQTVTLVTGGNRILLQKVQTHAVLVLVAKETVTEAFLKDLARRVLERLPPPSNGAGPRRVTLGPNLH